MAEISSGSDRSAGVAKRAAPGQRGRSGADELALRELTGFEEEYVERHRDDPNTSRLCNEILARCLVPPGEDPGEARGRVERLLVAERDRALIRLRRMSLGDEVESRSRCPACDAINETSFGLDNIDVDFPRPPEQVTVQLHDGTEATLRLPRAGDQADLLDQKLQGPAERRTWLLARLLVRYGTDQGDFDLDFARGLPVRTRHLLEAALERVVPDLDLSLDVECPECGHRFAAPFDVAAFFLRS